MFCAVWKGVCGPSVFYSDISCCSLSVKWSCVRTALAEVQKCTQWVSFETVTEVKINKTGVRESLLPWNISVTYYECVRVCVCVCLWLSSMQSTCPLLYCYLWSVGFYRIFPHCLVEGRIFGKNLSNITCVFLLFLRLFSKTFPILRRIKRDIFIDVKTSACRLSVIGVGFLNSVDRFRKHSNIKFHQNPSSGSRAVPCGRTNGHISRFSQFCVRA